MKTRIAVLGSLLCGMFLLTGYDRTRAESNSQQPVLKIGLVSIRRIFRESKVSSLYRQQVTIERQKTEAKLAQLKKEVELEEAALATLRPDSDDYLVKLKTILAKRAEFQTEKDFYNKKMTLLEQQTTEQLYKNILEQTEVVARERGLDLVFERSEPQIPAAGPSQLELAMGTHKLLYVKDYLDITDEVMARIDAGNAEKSQGAVQGRK